MNHRFFILVLAAFLVIADAGALNQNEKISLQEIEEAILRGEYETARYECDLFLRKYKRSRARRKVKKLRDAASKKIKGQHEKEAVDYRPEKKEYVDYGSVYYIVQVGAFANYGNAKQLKSSLIRKGFDAIIVKVRRARNTFYRVRAGKFRYLGNAKRLSVDLNGKGYTCEIIEEKT